MKRRSFINSGAAAGLSFLGLQKYLAASSSTRIISPYGDLIPDPKKLLDLPKGFSYKIIAQSGKEMEGGLKVPGVPDGMAAFPGKNGRVILVCNHEISAGAQAHSPFSEEQLPSKYKRYSYDPGDRDERPYLGGTTNIVYNPKTGKTEKHFLSLTGTDRNCAGGAMPWGSWITCEEPTDLNSSRGKNHGYCFEVKATDDGKLQKAVPLKKLGRYRHEAVAYDDRTGILYLTEDMNDGLLYRFIPQKKRNFTRGKLQALALVDKKSADTRNYQDSPDNMKEGATVEVTWIDVNNPESPRNDLRHRGFEDGAARFARGEGIIYSQGHFYICCTDGGCRRQGQVFKLTPNKDPKKNDHLQLFLEPKASDLLTNGDNICAAPWGDLVICEDLIANHAEKTPHLRGITPDGEIYTLAKNAHNKSEFAGSCFSPDGKILFVNMQTAGLTIAITGPWKT